MTTVVIATLNELPDVIPSVIEAVKYGKLDDQIEGGAEKGTADLRFKAKPMMAKKAS